MYDVNAIDSTIRIIISHGVGSNGLRGGRGKNSSCRFILCFPPFDILLSFGLHALIIPII
jgi:hypothetical protein